jgi:hypothetical protein
LSGIWRFEKPNEENFISLAQSEMLKQMDTIFVSFYMRCPKNVNIFPGTNLMTGASNQQYLLDVT